MVEVTVDGRTEWVTVTLAGDTPRAIASDGSSSGPFVDAAVALVSGRTALSTQQTEAKPTRRDAAARTSIAPPAERTSAPVPDRTQLAAALDDLVTAIVRVGVDQAAGAASVQDSLERLREWARTPEGLGVSFFIGHVRSALATHDAVGLAAALDGASRAAAALRSDSPTAAERERVAAWWGADVSEAVSTTRSGGRLIELGREWVAGIRPRSVERRYLMDLETGETLLEARRRSEPASLASVGRVLEVALSRVWAGPKSRRIEVLQYEVSVAPADTTFDEVLRLAGRDVVVVREMLFDAMKRYPVHAAPFVVVAPERWEFDRGVMIFDEQGEGLSLRSPLAHERDGIDERLASLRGSPVWVAGRVFVDAKGVALAPFSVGVRRLGPTVEAQFGVESASSLIRLR